MSNNKKSEVQSLARQSTKPGQNSMLPLNQLHWGTQYGYSPEAVKRIESAIASQFRTLDTDRL